MALSASVRPVNFRYIHTSIFTDSQPNSWGRRFWSWWKSERVAEDPAISRAWSPLWEGGGDLSGRALQHPGQALLHPRGGGAGLPQLPQPNQAGGILLSWSQFGCPAVRGGVRTGLESFQLIYSFNLPLRQSSGRRGPGSLEWTTSLTGLRDAPPNKYLQFGGSN